MHFLAQEDQYGQLMVSQPAFTYGQWMTDVPSREHMISTLEPSSWAKIFLARSRTTCKNMLSLQVQLWSTFLTRSLTAIA
jgi:hypothetical protein